VEEGDKLSGSEGEREIAFGPEKILAKKELWT
jgi:hypothetical protein